MKDEKHIIICAMCKPWVGPKPEGSEMWGVNRTFTRNDHLDRTYFFDSLCHFEDDFATGLNARNMDVYTRKEYPELPRSVKFPLDEVTEGLGRTEPYFTCTVAYMIAHAIFEGATKITLYGMYHIQDSSEYMVHIPCVNYWIGVAVGRGIEVCVEGDAMVARPFPWQSAKYGYSYQWNESLSQQTMAAAYMAALNYPIAWMTAEEAEEKIIEQKKADEANMPDPPEPTNEL
jgi:hypothetical protein